jgi:hypothetical protein
MKLIWDETIVIEPDNSSTKVMHDGVKYADRNAAMPSSVIPKHGKLEDVATPTNRIAWKDGYGTIPGKWENSGVFPWYKWIYKADGSSITYKDDIEPFYEQGKANIGKKIGLMIPLEIEGVKNEYTFWFEVKSAVLDTSFAAN